MPATRPTYELRLHTEPQAFPFGTSTLSRHRTYTAARNAWKYEERRFRASPYGFPNAWLSRVIVEVSPNGREYVADDYCAVRERHR